MALFQLRCQHWKDINDVTKSQ